MEDVLISVVLLLLAVVLCVGVGMLAYKNRGGTKPWISSKSKPVPTYTYTPYSPDLPRREAIDGYRHNSILYKPIEDGFGYTMRSREEIDQARIDQKASEDSRRGMYDG